MAEPSHSRVLLLDVRPHSETFVGEAQFERLELALREVGAEVVIQRHVQSPDVSTQEWFEALQHAVREVSPDVVGVSRAWDVTIPDALRAAAPAATLIRITGGVRANIDGYFDHVLAPRELVAFVGGAEPTSAEFKRKSARDARAEAFEAIVATGEIAESMTTAGDAARPTIHGPAGGCPYLRDSASTPPFASLDLDPQVYQTRGCTFCLDNDGAYAVLSEVDVVESWLTQLRAIRRAHPDAREVLLTMERPHPYLPAFFRALEGEPALAPIELLFKSRADWLLEFADTAIAEACTLAGRTGSRLHLYLMGFENFDPFHLELFNKGHSVDDSIEALTTMRRLSDRFPDTFEFRRHRAHGIVLFTPWTRPEHILENARVMREIGFSEVRSEAHLTRLRLYPRVPLHAKAESEGLLVDAFREHRPDRAIAQGYDASVPWRFEDPRMEVVFAVAGALVSRRRVPDEPSALELAAHFATRWPSLSNAPDVAHVALERALANWDHVPSLFVGPTSPVAVIDLELEQLRAGARSVALKENVPADDAESLIVAYEAMGFAASIASQHDLAGGGDDHVHGSTHVNVAVASDAATLDEALEMLAKHFDSPGPDAIRNMARLLGYPLCCAEAFAESTLRGSNVDNERHPFRRAPDTPLSPFLNRLGRARLVSHFACRPDCEASIGIARRTLAVLADADAQAASALLAELERPVLFIDYTRRALLSGAWREDVFEVDSFEVLGEGSWLEVPADRIRSLRVVDGSVVLSTADETQQLPRHVAILVEPGRPSHERFRTSLDKPAPAVGTPAREDDEARREREAAIREIFPTLPHVLSPRYSVEALRASHDGRRLELELSLGTPGSLVVQMEDAREGTRCFTSTERYALSYGRPDPEIPRETIIEAMKVLAAHVREAEQAPVAPVTD